MEQVLDWSPGHNPAEPSSNTKKAIFVPCNCAFPAAASISFFMLSSGALTFGRQIKEDRVFSGCHFIERCKRFKRLVPERRICLYLFWGDAFSVASAFAVNAFGPPSAPVSAFCITLFAKTIAAAMAITRQMITLLFVPILAPPQLHPGPHPDDALRL